MPPHLKPRGDVEVLLHICAQHFADGQPPHLSYRLCSYRLSLQVS